MLDAVVFVKVDRVCLCKGHASGRWQWFSNLSRLSAAVLRTVLLQPLCGLWITVICWAGLGPLILTGQLARSQ